MSASKIKQPPFNCKMAVYRMSWDSGDSEWNGPSASLISMVSQAAQSMIASAQANQDSTDTGEGGASSAEGSESLRAAILEHAKRISIADKVCAACLFSPGFPGFGVVHNSKLLHDPTSCSAFPAFSVVRPTS